jgi:hypothetical protein
LEMFCFFDTFAQEDFSYESCEFERFGDDIYLVSGESCALLCHLQLRWYADDTSTITPRINRDIEGIIPFTSLEAIHTFVWEEAIKGLEELMRKYSTLAENP